MLNELSKQFKDDWYYEFYPVSSISPNGHFTVKAGKVGVPVCIIPMPLGGVNTKEKQAKKAKLISTIPQIMRALLKVLETEYGCAPSVGYMDEIKKQCESAILKAIE